jgi:hypothetical protein
LTGMEKEDEKQKVVRFMLSGADQKELTRQVLLSTCRSQSEYIRKKILGKALVYQSRNRSLDDYTEELSQIKEELKAAVYNFDLATRKLSHFSQVPGAVQLLISFELDRRMLLKKIDKTSAYLRSCLEKWSQESAPLDNSSRP